MTDLSSPDSSHAPLDGEVEAFDQVMLRLSWASRRQLAQELDHFGLTVPQYVALRSASICENGCTMRDLAKAAQQVSPTMTGIVDRLSERGLVERRLDVRDRRAWRVFMTPAGMELLDAIEQQRRERLRRIMSRLKPEDRCELHLLMERYLEAVMADPIQETRDYGG